MNFKLLTILSLITALLISFTPLLKTGADEAPKVIDISTFPKDTFIEMNNMKPGDSVISSLEIKNDGNVDFIYNGKSRLKEGSIEYYNKLLLTITDSNNIILFDGLVKDFKFFEPRGINHSSSDNLQIIVKVPDLGNEYQGLFATILFSFFVDGEELPDDGDPPDPPDDGDPPDPPDDGDPPDPPDDGDPPDPPDDGDPPDPPDDGDPPDPPDDNEPPTEDIEPPSNNPPPTKPADPPSKDTGSLPQTGEENPLFIVLSGLFISLAGIGLLLIKKSILPNLFKRG
ncbi:LPXTG cell wall anchor domain-containing protein [Fictibacillus sp. NPDC058756]|uniref:LPXTG cell wall anchor domain-containing protein n=1 Tax=Fictibacillus sp. NPDC058756 TaxID=3346625 RepID=UPI00368C6A16